MARPPEDDSVDALARAATREHSESPAAGQDASEPRHPPVLLAWTFVAVAALVVVMRVDAIVGAMAPPPSLRAGAQASDAALDECVDRLWELAALLQQESPRAVAASELTEPLSGLPYVVSTTADDIVVSCPTPRRHRVSEVRSRTTAPQPEVVP